VKKQYQVWGGQKGPWAKKVRRKVGNQTKIGIRVEEKGLSKQQSERGTFHTKGPKEEGYSEKKH